MQLKEKSYSNNENTIFSSDELEFVIFCIENIALATGKTGTEVYNALAKKSHILQKYIVPSYDILHTQDKNYIVNDILQVAKEKGVCL